MNLPVDLVNHILEYNGGYIKRRRNGTYKIATMSQIRETDERYAMLRKITAKTYDIYRYTDRTVALCITRIVIPPTTKLHCQTELHLDIRTDNKKPYVEYFSWCRRSMVANRTFLYDNTSKTYQIKPDFM